MLGSGSGQHPPTPPRTPKTPSTTTSELQHLGNLLPRLEQATAKGAGQQQPQQQSTPPPNPLLSLAAIQDQVIGKGGSQQEQRQQQANILAAHLNKQPMMIPGKLFFPLQRHTYIYIFTVTPFYLHVIHEFSNSRINFTCASNNPFVLRIDPWLAWRPRQLSRSSRSSRGRSSSRGRRRSGRVGRASASTASAAYFGRAACWDPSRPS